MTDGFPSNVPDVTLSDYIHVIIPVAAVFVLFPLLSVAAKVTYDNRWYFQYRAAKWKLDRENSSRKRRHKEQKAFAQD
jgi:hypothetical protein